MNKKGQIHAIREVFQFGLGIVLLISVMYMFYNNFIPTVANYALTLEADNINSHINYLIMELVEVVNNNLITGSIELNYEMPGKIGDYSYNSYFSGGDICTIISGLSINNCLETNLNGINTNGIYLSGGDLNVVINKTNNGVDLRISN